MKKQFSSFNSLCVSMMTLAMLLTLLAGLASCKNELLEPPDFSDRGAYSSADISAPEVVVATQGGCRSITVSWSPVANAVKYEVYTSKIATGAFEKRTETNGVDKVSVVIREDPDVLAYYKVKAYDKNGNESEFSKMCHGTTLGSPIITNVIQDEFGKSATVRWWCGTYFSADTYKNDVEYLIELYADPEGTTQIAEQRMEGSSIKMTNDVSEGDVSAECTFTDLTPKTTYYYQVKAYLKNAPNDVEESAIVDRETARRLIPNPVEELEATQGVSDKTVTLSFILPDFVDVKESSDVFLKKPLYFEISRAEVEYTASDEIDEKTGRPIYKEGTKPLTDYTVIATIKSAASSEWEAMGSGGNTYYFDCSTSTGDNTSGKKLALEKTDSVQSNEGDAEPYIPGYKLTFTDTNAQRGDDKPPVYSYKITSYTDADKKVTSNESVAKTIGWLIGNLKMDLSKKKIEYEYTDEKKTEISKITVKFSCLIEDYGKDYTYIVTQSAVDTNDTPIVDETIVKTMDINELQNFSVVYDLKTDKEGYYSYKFYIAPTGTTNFSDAYYCYDKYKTKTPVTKDVPLEIERFEVEDGYSNKFVIKWSYDKDYAYKLDWTPVVNGVDQEQESMNLAESNENNDPNVGVIKSIDNGMATIEHEAQSGDVRKYSISITSRLSIPKELENPSYTLGTATPRQDGYDYDTITIKWDEVQKATSYTLEAWYEGTENSVQTFNTTDLVYQFTPDGSNDAMKAGKKMQVRVIAKNGKDSTKATEIPARLIGPALINASVNSYENAKEDSISLSWSAVEGANGYLIGRVMYDAEQTKIEANSNITYYYKVSSGKITVAQTDQELGGRAAVEANGTRFTLIDTYREAEDPYDPDIGRYQQEQSKIFWGKPFRYVVLPVLKEEDFEIEVQNNKVFSCNEYQNLDEMKTAATATCGYGLDVYAEKSKSRENQIITWKKPFSDGNKKPSVFKRKMGESGKFSLVEGSGALSADATTFDYKVLGDALYEAYEYIVRYDASPDDFSPPAPLIADFKEAKDEESETEQKNKGYLFAIKNSEFSRTEFSAKQGGVNTYAESVTWDTAMKIWGYENRALGPTGIKLYIRNNNLDDQWHEVAAINSIDYSGTAKSLENDTSVKISNNGVSLWPMGYDTGASSTTSGALKVLRDYKHYYALSLTRGDLETQKYTPGFDDFEKDSKDEDIAKVFAYRQITDEELVRAATLAMTIGFKHARDNRYGVSDNDKWSASNKAGSYTESALGLGSGKVTYESYGGGLGLIGTNVYHKVVYENYKPEMTAKSGEKVTFLTIDAQNENSLFGETWGKTAIEAPTEYHTLGQQYGSSTQYYITVTGPSDVNGLYSTKLAFYWLNTDKEPRYTDKEGYKGIKISHPNGNSERVFGNITPLPFVSDGSGSAGFKQDAEEWQ